LVWNTKKDKKDKKHSELTKDTDKSKDTEKSKEKDKKSESKDKKESKDTDKSKDTEEHKIKDSGEMSISNVGKGMTDAVGGMFGMKHKKDKKHSEHAKEIDENKESKHDDKKDKHNNEEKHEDEEKGIFKSSMDSIGNVFHSKKNDKKPKREKSEKHIRIFGKKKHEEHAKEIDENTKEIKEEKQESLEEVKDNNSDYQKLPITREGNLEKLSTGKIHLKSSHKRFCSLQTDSFLTYKSKKDQIASKSPLDSFPLGEIRVEEGKDKLCFDIIYKNNTATFKCSSNEELQIWISSINNNIQCHK